MKKTLVFMMLLLVAGTSIAQRSPKERKAADKAKMKTAKADFKRDQMELKQFTSMSETYQVACRNAEYPTVNKLFVKLTQLMGNEVKQVDYKARVANRAEKASLDNSEISETKRGSVQFRAERMTTLHSRAIAYRSERLEEECAEVKTLITDFEYLMKEDMRETEKGMNEMMNQKAEAKNQRKKL